MLAPLQQSQYPGGMFLLSTFSRCLDDLQVYFVLAGNKHYATNIGQSLTCPISAMVRPAKAPPRSTRPNATDK